MFCISISLQVFIWSGEFHGILKSCIIIGCKFSVIMMLRNLQILLKMYTFAEDSSLSRVGCKLKQIKSVVV